MTNLDVTAAQLPSAHMNVWGFDCEVTHDPRLSIFKARNDVASHIPIELVAIKMLSKNLIVKFFEKLFFSATYIKLNDNDEYLININSLAQRTGLIPSDINSLHTMTELKTALNIIANEGNSTLYNKINSSDNDPDYTIRFNGFEIKRKAQLPQ